MVDALELDLSPSARLVDASTVYAEGVLAGMRTAINIIESSSQYAICGECSHDFKVGVDKRLHGKLMQQIAIWRSTVLHNQWLAEQGRAAPLASFPDREDVMARIRAVVLMTPEKDRSDG